LDRACSPRSIHVLGDLQRADRATLAEDKKVHASSRTDAHIMRLRLQSAEPGEPATSYALVRAQILPPVPRLDTSH
jgi:hypothetical protein